jgi:hypothetical protein
MNRKHHRYAALAIGFSAIVLTGCPWFFPPQFDYDRGYQEGFLRDDYYWEGFFDSYDSMTFDDVFYQGSDIPFIDDLSYEAGFNDGLWTAYNDGYFTSYRYAFIVGWSEGYDAAFWPDYLNFLANDQHIENLNGGWGDGYNDGFSEGRVFGAFDFEDGRPFDWEDALLDYEDGVDLYFEEVNVGTGEFGPVVLYEWGTDPWDLKSARENRSLLRQYTPSIRNQPGVKAETVKQEMFRPLTSEAQSALNVLETEVPRNPRSVRFDSTHLQRINQYISGAKSEGEGSERTGARVVDAE